MIALEDYQFELGGVVFGIGAPISIDGDGFNPGDDDIVTFDETMYGSDAWAFGEDSRTPAVWAFAMHTDMARYPEVALADLAQLGKAWQGRGVNKVAGAVAPLRYHIAGRTRVVYGRPRHWSHSMSNRILGGFVPLNAEFQRVDAAYYDDVEQSTMVTNVPSEMIGLVAPIISPVTTLAGGHRDGTIATVGGDLPAPFVATIEAGNGSVLNPKLYGDGWEIQLLTQLPPNSSVVINTYPWGYKAIRSDGANLSGTVSARTRFSKARLDPAGETLNYSAIDSSGTSRCSIVWRRTFSTI